LTVTHISVYVFKGLKVFVWELERIMFHRCSNNSRLNKVDRTMVIIKIF